MTAAARVQAELCLVPRCPHLTQDTFCRWHRHQSHCWRVDEELGLMRLCTRCEEWYPADDEFFYPNVWRCRACVCEEAAEQEQRRRAA